MTRKKRINRNKAFYHITLRGNNQKTIFYNDKNRCRFCLLLQEAIERYDHKIHGFCLMGNHLHLLIQASKKPIYKTIHSVAGRYAKYLNLYTNAVGHQFEKRYHSKLIQDQNYLYTVLKYIHLNPIDANIATTPSEYYWSSHNCYINKDEIPWLTTNEILSMFSENHSQSVKQYKAFMSEKLDEDDRAEIENPSSDKQIIGSEEFIKEILQETCPDDLFKNITLNMLMNEVCTELNISPKIIFHKSKNRQSANARGILAYYVNEFEHLKLAELARLTKKSSATLSKQAMRISRLSKTDINISRIILNINVKLGKRLVI